MAEPKDGVYVMYAWRCRDCMEDSAGWSELEPPVTFHTEAEARAAYQQHLLSPWHGEDDEDDDDYEEASYEDGRAMLERKVMDELGTSLATFLDRLDSGHYRDSYCEVAHLAIRAPFAQKHPSP